MALLPRSFGERVWFRLSDVPPDIRFKAAERERDRIARTEALDDPLRAIDEARAIEHAAENPSDTIRVISAKAWVSVMGELP